MRILKLKRLFTSKKLVRTTINSFWMISDKVVAMFISIFIGALVARYLGPENYGILNYSLSIIAIFGAICTLGLESIIVKEFVDKQQTDGKVIGTALSMQFASTIFAIVAIILIVQFTSPHDQLLQIISLIQSAYLIFKTSEIFEFWFQSRLKSKYVTFSRLGSQIIVAGFKMMLVFLKADIVWFAFSNMLDFLVFAFWIFLIYRHAKGDMHFSFSYSLSRSFLSQSWPFILSGLAVTIYMRLDQIMLAQMLGNRVVGIYSAASYVASFWYFVPGALINSARPGIMELSAKKSAKYMMSLEVLFGLIFWFCIAVAFITTFVASPVIALLYGSNYEEAAVVLSINVWAGAFALLGSARGTWIICEKLQVFTMYYILFGLGFKILLNLWLIKPFGILGASYSTLLCQFAVAFIFPLFFAKTRIIVSSQIKGISLFSIYTWIQDKNNKN